MGTLLNGKCSLIPGCIDFIQNQDNSQTCLACNQTTFTLNVEKGVCECLSGTILFAGACVPTVEGCIAYGVAADGSRPCIFCNISQLYSGLPNSQGQCSCRKGYESVNGTCAEVCGDGLKMDSLSKYCDDGNLEDNDGCSSACLTEKFYRCVNGSDSSSSVCVYSGLILNVSLAKISKTEG